MKELQDRILREGKNLGNGILKVDGFVNHQVDPQLMDACGREFARRFRNAGSDQDPHRRNFRHRPGVDDRFPFRSAGSLRPQA